MNFLYNIKDFLIQESVKQAKEILSKKGINPQQNENYQKLEKLLKKKPNLIGNFTNFYFEQNIEMDELENTINWIIQNKELVKRLPKNIQNYNDYHELHDDIQKVNNDQKVHKFYKSLYKELQHEINPNNERFYNLALEFMNLPQEKRNEFPPFKHYRINNVSADDFLKAIEDFIKKGKIKNNKKNVLKHLKKYSKDEVKIVYNKDNILVIRTDDKDVVAEFGSDKWCIVYAQDAYWETFLGKKLYTVQYIIFNFNLPSYVPQSMYGITINPDGTILKRPGTCQNRRNIPASVKDIIEKTEIPEDVFLQNPKKEYYEKHKSLLNKLKDANYKDKSIINFLSILKSEEVQNFKYRKNFIIESQAYFTYFLEGDILNNLYNGHINQHFDNIKQTIDFFKKELDNDFNLNIKYKENGIDKEIYKYFNDFYIKNDLSKEEALASDYDELNQKYKKYFLSNDFFEKNIELLIDIFSKFDSGTLPFYLFYFFLFSVKCKSFFINLDKNENLYDILLKRIDYNPVIKTRLNLNYLENKFSDYRNFVDFIKFISTSDNYINYTNIFLKYVNYGNFKLHKTFFSDMEKFNTEKEKLNFAISYLNPLIQFFNERKNIHGSPIFDNLSLFNYLATKSNEFEFFTFTLFFKIMVLFYVSSYSSKVFNTFFSELSKYNLKNLNLKNFFNNIEKYVEEVKELIQLDIDVNKISNELRKMLYHDFKEALEDPESFNIEKIENLKKYLELINPDKDEEGINDNINDIIVEPYNFLYFINKNDKNYDNFNYIIKNFPKYLFDENLEDYFEKLIYNELIYDLGDLVRGFYKDDIDEENKSSNLNSPIVTHFLSLDNDNAKKWEKEFYKNLKITNFEKINENREEPKIYLKNLEVLGDFFKTNKHTNPFDEELITEIEFNIRDGVDDNDINDFVFEDMDFFNMIFIADKIQKETNIEFDIFNDENFQKDFEKLKNVNKNKISESEIIKEFNNKSKNYKKLINELEIKLISILNKEYDNIEEEIDLEDLEELVEFDIKPIITDAYSITIASSTIRKMLDKNLDELKDKIFENWPEANNQLFKWERDENGTEKLALLFNPLNHFFEIKDSEEFEKLFEAFGLSSFDYMEFLYELIDIHEDLPIEPHYEDDISGVALDKDEFNFNLYYHLIDKFETSIFNESINHTKYVIDFDSFFKKN